VAGVAAVLWTGGVSGEAGARTVARAGAAVAVYVTLMVASDLTAASGVRKVAREAGLRDVRAVMVAPRPAEPLAGDVVVATGEGYVPGSHRWLRSPAARLEPERATPRRRGVGVSEADVERAVDGARRDGRVRDFLAWSRFPRWRRALRGRRGAGRTDGGAGRRVSSDRRGGGRSREMIEWFAGLHPVLQALLATLGTWGLTALGAAAVFFFREVDRKVLDVMLGFAAGVMIAASFWSLLAPAIEMAEGSGVPSWLPALAGFLLGGAFLWGVDLVLPHVHPGFPRQEAEGVPSELERSILLILAITLHNIPEGLAVGVAFGALGAGAGAESVTLGGAVALALGIGIQNMPEGTAVSVPLRREGFGRFRAFWYGQLSAVVEPVAGVLGAAAVLTIRPILPYALAFAAGAMIYVVVEELVPESQAEKHSDLPTLGAMGGFALMMFLDVALG